MIDNRKRLCLALAMALASAGLGATEMTTAEREQLRQELREAQSQLAEVGRRVAELSAQIGDDPARVQMFRYLGNPDRAVIGVLLGDEGKDGVTIEGVTPGGPAEKAGLRSGDTITAVRGTRIAGERPSEALRAALRDLKDGDKVALSYVRDGKTYSTEVVATRQGSFDLLAGPQGRAFWFEHGDLPVAAPLPPDFDEQIEAIVERAVGDADGMRINVMTMSGLGGLRLTSLNEGLGRYFGVTEGALVLEVDAARYPGLQAGDVILEVAGKPVKDPRDAMRELGRQDPQSQVELKVQRDRVPQLVKISVPEKSRAFMAPPPPPPPPPAAPRAPAPAPMASPHPAAAPVAAPRAAQPVVV